MLITSYRRGESRLCATWKVLPCSRVYSEKRNDMSYHISFVFFLLHIAITFMKQKCRRASGRHQSSFRSKESPYENCRCMTYLRRKPQRDSSPPWALAKSRKARPTCTVSPGNVVYSILFGVVLDSLFSDLFALSES